MPRPTLEFSSPEWKRMRIGYTHSQNGDRREIWVMFYSVKHANGFKPRGDLFHKPEGWGTEQRISEIQGEVDYETLVEEFAGERKSWRTKAMPVWINKFGPLQPSLALGEKNKMTNELSQALKEAEKSTKSTGATKRGGATIAANATKRQKLENANTAGNSPAATTIEPIDEESVIRAFEDLSQDVTLPVHRNMMTLVQKQLGSVEPPTFELIDALREDAQEMYQSNPNMNPKIMWAYPAFLEWKEQVARVPKEEIAGPSLEDEEDAELEVLLRMKQALIERRRMLSDLF